MIRISVLLCLLLLSTQVATAGDRESEDIIRISGQIHDCDAEWIAGITSVSGLTDVEKARLSFPGGRVGPSSAIRYMSVDMLRHEAKYNWADLGMVSPVKSQGGCGSCWAFGAVAAVESAYLIYADVLTDLSEQHLVADCSRSGTCDGGWPDWALEYIRDTGIPSEECYPYVGRDEICDPCDDWDDESFKITEFMYVEPNTGAFKDALREYGPMVVVLSVPNDWYYYREGVYSPISPLGWANHVVLLTGWDDSDGCWFIKNSWGTGWGEQGYARVKYGVLEQYEYAYVVTGVDIGAEPDPEYDVWVKPFTASATSSHAREYAAEMAVDNDASTYWFSNASDPEPHITFAMLEPTLIGKVALNVHGWFLPITVTIETSGGREVWDPAVSLYTLENESAIIEFEPTICRYVRMTQTDLRWGWSNCAEFDVWKLAPPEPEPVSQTTISIQYVNRTEVIVLGQNLSSILVLQNGVGVVEWWANT